MDNGRDKGNAQLGASGSVTWEFDRLGWMEATHPDEVEPETEAIEAGAQDLEASESDEGTPDGTIFYTDPTDLDAVRRALEELSPIHLSEPTRQAENSYAGLC